MRARSSGGGFLLILWSVAQARPRFHAATVRSGTIVTGRSLYLPLQAHVFQVSEELVLATKSAIADGTFEIVRVGAIAIRGARGSTTFSIHCFILLGQWFLLGRFGLRRFADIVVRRGSTNPNLEVLWI